MREFVPVMWGVWGVLVLLLAIVSLYTSHLGKNEEDQLFLGDALNHVKSEQEAILARVQKVEPIRKTMMGLAGIMTLFVIGYYLLNIIHQLR
jgi:hypothetical protein